MVRCFPWDGPTGEIRAQNAMHLKGGARFGFIAFLLLVGLLVLPALALVRLPIDWRIAGGYAAVVSLIAYWTYYRDKARARANEWRISEATLHSIELVGGWPGAFVAQRRLRHKCSKKSYQALFWVIVLLYQLAALDILQGGRLSQALRQAFDAESR